VEKILEGNSVVVVLTSDSEDLTSEDRASADALLGRRRGTGRSSRVTRHGGGSTSGSGGLGNRTQNGEKLNGDVDGLGTLLNNHLNSTNTGEVASRSEARELQLEFVGGLTSGKSEVAGAEGRTGTRVHTESNDGAQIREDTGAESKVAVSTEIEGTKTVSLEVEGSISTVPLHSGVTLSTIRGGTLEVSVGNTSGHEQVGLTRDDNQLKITFITDDGTISGGSESSLGNRVDGVVLSGDDDLTGNGGELIDDDGIPESSALSESTSHEGEAEEKKGRSHQSQG